MTFASCLHEPKQKIVREDTNQGSFDQLKINSNN